MKKVAAIVVTYNRKELLYENIICLKKQSCKDVDILIIDNASDDGTKDYIKNFVDNKNVFYYNTGANLGGAGGFQYGVKKAVESGYKYVWLMDDDAMPQKNALHILMKVADKLNDNFGFLSGKVLWKDMSICKMNIQKKNLIEKVRDFNVNVQRIQMATFVSCFIRSDVIKDVGLPIKEFFIWADDLEYTRRISMKYPCYLVNRSVVIHKCMNNCGSDICSDMPEKLERYRYAYRNEVYIYRREGIMGWIYWILKDIYHVCSVVVKSPEKKCKKIGIIISSAFKGLVFHPAIEYVKEKK